MTQIQETSPGPYETAVHIKASPLLKIMGLSPTGVSKSFNAVVVTLKVLCHQSYHWQRK